MEVQQNPTENQTVAKVTDKGVGLDFQVTPAQDQYIAFVALGGLVPDPDGAAAGRKMTATQLAEALKVDRSTLYDWRTRIPDFWDRVAAKRKELGGRDRVSAVWNGVYLKAATGDAQAAKLFLKNFDENYVDPSTKVEHEIGNSWSALIQAKRAKANEAVIEGEVIDAA